MVLDIYPLRSSILTAELWQLPPDCKPHYLVSSEIGPKLVKLATESEGDLIITNDEAFRSDRVSKTASDEDLNAAVAPARVITVIRADLD